MAFERILVHSRLHLHFLHFARVCIWLHLHFLHFARVCIWLHLHFLHFARVCISLHLHFLHFARVCIWLHLHLQFLKALVQPTSVKRAAHRPTKTKKALTQQPAGDVVSAEEEDRPDDGWDSAPDDWAPDALASGNNKPPLVITAFNCIHMHIPAYVAL